MIEIIPAEIEDLTSVVSLEDVPEISRFIVANSLEEISKAL